MTTAQRAIVVLLLVASSGRQLAIAHPKSTERISHQQSRLARAQHELHVKKQELQSVQIRVDDYAKQLRETNERVTDVSGRIVVLSSQKASAEERLSATRRALASAQATLQLSNAAYARNLVRTYEQGDEKYLAVLLGARSFADFVERWADTRLMVSADQDAITLRRRAAQEFEAREAQLEVAQSSLDRAVEKQENARSELSALSEERRQLLVVASAQRARVAQQVVELEEMTAQEEAALRALIVAGQGTPGTSTLGPPSATGSLIWPVRGPITSPFGWRMHPIYHRLILHEGIDIGADTGTPIKAADGGRVLIAGWVSGYGNYIAIDHGSGISTGYGHCSAIFVAVGQNVQKGQVIGDVGSTGNSTGPHLHFEVRVRGVPTDPLARLSP